MNNLYPCTQAEANALQAQCERKTTKEKVTGLGCCQQCEDPDAEIHCTCERCYQYICESCTYSATQHNFIDYNCCNDCAQQ